MLWKINTNIHNCKIPKEDSQFIWLLVILIDPVFSAGKNYYPQIFLQECKYIIKEKKISNYIIDDVEITNEKNSDEEDSGEKDSDEEDLIMKILI